MNLKAILAASAMSLLAATSIAADSKLKAFAEGVTLTASGSRPVQDLALPDRVYASVSQWNLADLRVFNANGDAIPHAFCNSKPAVFSSAALQVPVYDMDARHAADATQSNITLHTADGTSLTVETSADKNHAYGFRNNASYILDLRKVGHDINAVRLDWSLLSGSSETSVSLLSSTDLAHWQPIVSNAKLLRAVADDHSTLELSRVELPFGRYQYLRIEPTGDELSIKSANVEYRVATGASQPTWYSAGVPHAGDEPNELRYDNSHHAPISLLRITPRVENSSVHVAVQSRDREDHAWQTQWTGEIFDLHFDGQTRLNDAIAINTTSASQWRLLFAENTDLPASTPSFEFGYVPAHLRFLAQGTGPYTLAYGNAHLTSVTARACDDLLAGIDVAERNNLIGTPTIGSTQVFGGKEALVIKKQIPSRTLLLWGILLIGVAVIMKLAFSLLKNSKQDQQE